MKQHPDPIRLDDYFEGRLDAADSRGIDEHVEHCAECRRHLDALNELLMAAGRLPREQTPPATLWQEIAGRLSPRPQPAADRFSSRASWTGALAVAGLILIVVALWIGSPLWRGKSSLPLSATAAGATGDAFFAATLDYLQDESRYASAEFSAFALAKGEGASAPTLALITENLKIVDLAIDEIRRALDAHPGDRHLEGRLLAAYRGKVRLQSQSTRLITGI